MAHNLHHYLVSGPHTLYSSEHQTTEEAHETPSAKCVMLGAASSVGDAAFAELSSCLLVLVRVSKVREALNLATGFSA
jgi:hypothetical protein